MKSIHANICMLAALAAAAPHLLQAQQVTHTAEEIIVSGNFYSGDDDLAIIDRVTGEVRSLDNGAVVVDGPVLLTGLGDVSEATSGNLGLAGSAHAVMLVSTAAQKLGRVSPSEPAGAVSIYESPEPVPVGAVAHGFPTLPFSSESSNDLWVTSWDSTNSRLSAHEVSVSSLSTEASSGRPVRLREGRRAQLSTTTRWYPAFMTEDGSGSSLRFFSSNLFGTSFNLQLELSGLPVGATFVWGSLDATSRSTFVFFVPGSPTLHWIRTTSSSSAAVTNTYTASAGVESLIPVNQGAAHGVWALLDSGSQMQLLQFDGTGFSVTQTLDAPAGQRWTGGMVPPGGSRMLMLQGPAASGRSTSWERFDVQGDGTYTSESQGVLPGLVFPSPAHVFAFSGEPFVDPDAVLTDSRRVDDWTLGTGELPVSLAMIGQKETYGGESTGLGARAAFNAGTAAVGSTWMMANQYAADTSVFALSPTMLTPGEPEVTILPESTHEELPLGAQSPPAVRTFSFESTGAVYYRTSATDNFSFYNPTNPDPQFSFSSVPASTTVEFYAAIGSKRSRLGRATYTFGAVDPITAPSSTDADSNGLADEWERWYGLTDPNGDPDGDGINNITEQNAGSDPLDGGESLAALDYTLEFVWHEGVKCVGVTLNRPFHGVEALQTSVDMTNWTDIPLEPGALEHTVTIPITSIRQFYRINR